MTTSQNTPAPEQGRHHHRAQHHNGLPAEYAGPPTGRCPDGPSQPGLSQASGGVPPYAQHPQQIPAQWGPSYPPRSAPAQPYPSQPHPSQAYPAQPPMGQPPMGQPSVSQPYGPRPDLPQPYAGRPYPSPSQPVQPPPVPAEPQPAPSAAPAPRNGLGITALCLGIVGILFGLVPFTGFVAFALGAIGIILGLVGFARARRRVATNTKTALAGAILSIIAIALGIWGMVIVFTGLNQLSQDLSQIPTPSTAAAPGSPALPADVTTPFSAGAKNYQLEVTGDARKIMVGYGTNNANSTTPDYQSLPWRKTVEATGDSPYASVYATTSGPGSVTCTITDTATGAVVANQTSKSLDDSQYASATVSCNTMN